jgi:CPA2 family monovalent cation:H+ antiporter-2
MEDGCLHHYELILILTAGFSIALVFGYITQRLKLSPILGYLLAGFMVGPHSPGYIADIDIANQLAEVGVILLMFGVGLHFQLRDLIAVQKVSVPGALGQTLVATCFGWLIAMAMGWGSVAGLVFGMAIAVASTVVLLRILMDNHVLETPQGHVAIGWLVVEDIITVLALVLLPAVALVLKNPGQGVMGIVVPLGIALLKLAVMAFLLLGVGSKVVLWVLEKVARTRSQELFTLSILAIVFLIAALSTYVFGASMALGAFLAGMIVAKSAVSHQAAADALPLRDAFAVLFFISVGMLFDPSFLVAQPKLILACLAVILVVKPLVALLIVLVLGYSVRTGLTVALALAQIGEFSFILAQEALNLKLLPPEAYSVLVSCALLSIALNPLLFKLVGPIERALRQRPGLWRLLSGRNERLGEQVNQATQAAIHNEAQAPLAIVVGYGPVGQRVSQILENYQIRPVIIDLNIDTVSRLGETGRLALFGNAEHRDMLIAAGVEKALFLLITLPDTKHSYAMVAHARDLNPNLKIYLRARYVGEGETLSALGVDGLYYEEKEVAEALAQALVDEVERSATP